MKKLLLGAVMAALFMSDASALTKTARATIDQEQIAAIGADHESKISPAMQQLLGLEGIITSHWSKEDTLKVKAITPHLNTLKKNVHTFIAFLELFLTDRKKASAISSSATKTVTAINAIQTAAIALKANPIANPVCTKQISDTLKAVSDKLNTVNGQTTTPIFNAVKSVRDALSTAINNINSAQGAVVNAAPVAAPASGGRRRG